MGKSSKDKRDAYYRLAKEQGWRARSAFKLLQLDEEFNLFENVTRVVDLCAAPGSWSQVLSRVLTKGERFGRAGFDDRMERLERAVTGGESKLEQQKRMILGEEAAPRPEGIKPLEEKPRQPRKNVKIVAIDLQPMSPLEGITTLRADITHPTTVTRLLDALDPPDPENPEQQRTKPSNPVDLILCDGAPDVTGLHDLDVYVQSQLLFAALNLALCVLKPGGTFVAKIFRAADVDLLYAQFRILFPEVTVAKPRASRASSIEAFIVCQDFHPPKGLDVSLEKPLMPGELNEENGLKRPKTVPSRTVREDGVIDVELSSESESEDEMGISRGARWIAPFLACGSLEAYDADATYRLPKDHVPLDPVQPPTAPPYKDAVEERRRQGGAYGKTKKMMTGREKKKNVRSGGEDEEQRRSEEKEKDVEDDEELNSSGRAEGAAGIVEEEEQSKIKGKEKDIRPG